ncbi:MAG: polysaccharide pyruvyl transferase family protein, partial [Pirellulaceae bacterium]|nr:polysaccharide pyruvyl transferase family protein [Pirellulaceae bacterium]
MAQPQRILLRSSWQVANIGDLSHTPGVLALLERYLPNTQVRLWASYDFSVEATAMCKRRFPNFQVVKGLINSSGRANNPALQDALDWCDFLLHGSGPSLVAQRDLTPFIQFYGKPFGVYGITYSGGNAEAAAIMSQARFVYFRDSVSLNVARSEQISSPVMRLAPDGGFGCDLRNDRVARAWLASKQLEPRKFVCCVPRARYTPYWLLRSTFPFDPVKNARNLEMFEHDHAPLRRTIEM